jgi:hypothetical protein
MIGFQCIDIKIKQYNKNLIYEWISIVGYNSKKHHNKNLTVWLKSSFTILKSLNNRP